MYPSSQRQQQTAEQSNALKALFSDKSHSGDRNSSNKKKKVDASFVTPESIQKMLKDMNLPHKLDHHATKFYQQVCELYVHKVFDLSMEYANQRQSTNIEMKDVLRAIKKYSVLPPNQWNQIRLKGTHPLRKNRGKNPAATTHKRRLNIARRSLKMMDKNSRKTK